jgi:hypothetical protein
MKLPEVLKLAEEGKIKRFKPLFYADEAWCYLKGGIVYDCINDDPTNMTVKIIECDWVTSDKEKDDNGWHEPGEDSDRLEALETLMESLDKRIKKIENITATIGPVIEQNLDKIVGLAGKFFNFGGEKKGGKK